MESIKRSIKYQLKEDKTFSITFWITMLLLGTLAYAVNFYSNRNGAMGGIGIWHSFGEEGFAGKYVSYVSVAGANIIPMLVVFVIYTYGKYYEQLPISLSLSITRTDFMKSLIVSNIAVAFVFSSIQAMLMKIDPLIVKALGMNPLYDLSYINTDTDSVIFIAFSTFLIILLFISLWTMIASLNYKFGGKLWLAFVLINIFLFNVELPMKRALPSVNIFDAMVRDRVDLTQAVMYIILISVFYGIAYITTWRAYIRHKSN